MIEIIVRIVRHPETLHHALRRHVACGREGDDFVQLERGKSVVECGARALSGVTVASCRNRRRGVSMIMTLRSFVNATGFHPLSLKAERLDDIRTLAPSEVNSPIR